MLGILFIRNVIINEETSVVKKVWETISKFKIYVPILALLLTGRESPGLS